MTERKLSRKDANETNVQKARDNVSGRLSTKNRVERFERMFWKSWRSEGGGDAKSRTRWHAYSPSDSGASGRLAAPDSSLLTVRSASVPPLEFNMHVYTVEPGTHILFYFIFTIRMSVHCEKLSLIIFKPRTPFGSSLYFPVNMSTDGNFFKAQISKENNTQISLICFFVV